MGHFPLWNCSLFSTVLVASSSASAFLCIVSGVFSWYLAFARELSLLASCSARIPVPIVVLFCKVASSLGVMLRPSIVGSSLSLCAYTCRSPAVRVGCAAVPSRAGHISLCFLLVSSIA